LALPGDFDGGVEMCDIAVQKVIPHLPVGIVSTAAKTETGAEFMRCKVSKRSRDRFCSTEHTSQDRIGGVTGEGKGE
jgi:hypothetical protein